MPWTAAAARLTLSAAPVLGLSEDNALGALKELGHSLSHQTVKTILADHGLDPSPRRRKGGDWGSFIRSHMDCLLATDFFTTEVWTVLGLMSYYVLFFVHLGTRKVYIAGITAHPNEQWMRQMARNLTMLGDGLIDKCRYLIHDRDAKFSSGFGMIFRCAEIKPLLLPPRSPNLNAFAERFVRSIKQECLDRMIFFSEASLRHAVSQYIEHYHHERPHQGKDNVILLPLQYSIPPLALNLSDTRLQAPTCSASPFA